MFGAHRRIRLSCLTSCLLLIFTLPFQFTTYRIICNLFWLIILCNLLYFVHRSTSCLNKVVWKLTMHVRCQTGDAHACSVTLYRTIKKNTICWVSYCSCDPETLELAWFCRQKNMQSITVIFMWGEHHLAHVRHSCWCQVSTGFLIIRSRNLYRCLHGFLCVTKLHFLWKFRSEYQIV